MSLTVSQRNTKTTWRRFKAALTGLFLICVSLTSGCKSVSSLPPEPSGLTVDASLMVQSNYTNQLLEVLSK
ncbi:Rz1 lysis protein [Pectobacterium phage Q19]|uniref:Rz1 lysis protein n=1 Tax=Pectobacterium phage Q19 TaxID=2500576 RepID=A0A7S8ZWK8_9CAUD|nr:Rz1 lysis protein [Pectobacterium phage Q19]